MTRNEFDAICTEYTIDPALALENETVCAYIHQNDIEGLRQTLEDEF